MSDEWRDYQKLVLSELRRLNDNLEKLNNKTQQNAHDIAVMKVRSGFWGSVSGMVTVVIALIVESIFRKT